MPTARSRVLHLLAPIALTLLMTPLFVRAEDQPRPKLQSGDRIVFFGDSITQAGAGPKGYISVLRESIKARLPDTKVELIGAGISGNKVPDLQKRLDNDVLKHRPTIVVIYIGINDVWHGETDPARGTLPDAFTAGLEDLVARICNSSAETRIVLCTPSVIGEKTDGSNRLDSRLDQYATLSRTLAKKHKLVLCDLRQAFLDELKKSNPDNKESGILTSDRVHLNDAGNRFVAETLLDTLSPDSADKP